MTLSVTHPVAILNILELVLNIIIAGLIANLSCLIDSLEVYRFQFINGIVYGYLIVNVIITLAIFLPGSFNKTLRMVASGCGSILWLAAAALILQSADTGMCQTNVYISSYDRSVAGGVLSLALFLTQVVEVYFVYRHLED